MAIDLVTPSLVVSSHVTVRSKNVRQDTEEGGTWEGKGSRRWEKEKKGTNREVSTFMDSK